MNSLFSCCSHVSATKTMVMSLSVRGEGRRSGRPYRNHAHSAGSDSTLHRNANTSNACVAPQ